MTKTRIMQGDAAEVLLRLRPASIASIVTDPPYGLEFLGEEWDKLAKPKRGKLGGFADGRKPSFQRVRHHLPEMQLWHERWASSAYRALKPGGHLLATSATRTLHHLAVALERSGFEIRDCMCWIYATGFPKSSNVGVAIAKLTGRVAARGAETLTDIRGGQLRAGRDTRLRYTRPRLIPLGRAADWDGWGTALKPAWEPILVARKPLAERTLTRNILAHGSGALNVSACRIPYASRAAPINNWYRKDLYATARRSLFQGREHRVMRGPGPGRFPANVLCDSIPPHGPLPGVIVSGAGLSNTAARGDEIRRTATGGNVYGEFCARSSLFPRRDPESGPGDGILGPYTRFFRLPIEDPVGPRFFVVPKPGKNEKGRDNCHPTVKPVRLFRYLIRLVTPPGEVTCDPFLGSGTSAVAARIEGIDFVGIEKNREYISLARCRLREWRQLESQRATESRPTRLHDLRVGPRRSRRTEVK